MVLLRVSYSMIWITCRVVGTEEHYMLLIITNDTKHVPGYRRSITFG